MTSMFGFCKNDPTIPIDHLDYKYIENCNDINKLQRILQILRSGDEGWYPSLEEFAEKQLSKKNPNSSLLDKTNCETSSSILEHDERSHIVKNLQGLKEEENRNDKVENQLPPVRGSGLINMDDQKPATVDSSKKKNRALPRSYDEWSHIEKNIDADLEKQDKPEALIDKPKDVFQSLVKNQNNIHTGSSAELLRAAENEKNKGNEAFRSCDYEEALIYYDRSLNVMKTPAVYNNRAITNIKLKKYLPALDDCNQVINKESKNIKAYLRRGLAYQGLGRLSEALIDFSKVVELEPANKRGLELLKEITSEMEKQSSTNDSKKKKGKRLIVEDVDSSEPSNYISVGTASEHNEQTALSDHNRRIDGEVSIPNNSLESEGTLHDKPIINDAIPEIRTSKLSEIHKENEVPVQNDQNKKKAKRLIIEELSSSEKPNIDSTSQSSAEKKISEKELNLKTTKPAPPREFSKEVLVWKNTGNESYKSGQYPEALKCYTSAIEFLIKDPVGHEKSLSVLYNNRAICEMKIGRLRECINDCTKSIEYTPSAKAYTRRAAAYESKEKYLDAYADYQLAQQLQSFSDYNTLQALSRVSNILKSEHGSRWRDILPSRGSRSISKPTVVNNSQPAESVLKDESSSLPPLKKQESPPLKKENKEELTEISFLDSKTKGNNLVKQGKYSEAIQHYSHCIELKSNEVTSYTNRALCFLKTMQASKAVSDCDTALNLCSDNIKALFRRASAYKILHQYKEALVDLTCVLKIEPSNTAAKKETDECRNLFRQELLEIQMKNEEERRQKKKGKRVVIEEVSNGNGLSTGYKGKTKVESSQSTGVQSKTAQLRKMTAYEFLQAWNSIKSGKSTDYAELLKQIEDPSKLPELLSNKLDGNIIKHFIRAVHDHYTSKETYKHGIQLLKSLSRTSRFVMMLMFLSTADKTSLKTTVDILETRLKQNGEKTTDISSLRATYKCS